MFFVWLTVISGFADANPLSNIWMNNQECKTRPYVVNVNEDEPVLFHLVLKQVNVMITGIISIICMQKFVFLML